MSQSISEFIFFKVKPEVRPEDPASTEGHALLSVFRASHQQSGHRNSAWGRVVEEEDVIVWVVGTLLLPHPITFSILCSIQLRSICLYALASILLYRLHIS